MHPWSALIAQAAAKAPPLPQVLAWLGALIFAGLALGLTILFFRRRLLSKDSGSEMQSGLMASLREMRDDGRLSPEEFDTARKRMAARAAGRDPDTPAPARAQPRPPPRAATPGEVRSRPGFDLTGAPLPNGGSAPPAPPREKPPHVE